MLKKTLCLIVLITLATVVTQAQRYSRVSKFRMSAGLALGSKSNFKDDNVEGKFGTGANVGLEYMFHKQFSGALSYTYFFTGSDIITYLGAINLDGRYYFISEKRDTKFYLLLGYSSLSATTETDVVKRKESEGGLNLGIGMNHAFNKDWGYNIQAKYQTAGEGQLVFNLGLIKSF